jgi:hypothetical protein
MMETNKLGFSLYDGNTPISTSSYSALSGEQLEIGSLRRPVAGVAGLYIHLHSYETVSEEVLARIDDQARQWAKEQQPDKGRKPASLIKETPNA